MHQTRRTHCGFTLIELLITLAIAGILAMIAAPAMGGLLVRSQTEDAEAAIANALHLARTNAVMHDHRVLVCPSNDGRHCQPGVDWQHGWIVFDDTDRNGQPDAGGKGLNVFARLPDGVRIITSTGREHIVFHPNGNAAGSNARFTICDARQETGESVVIANSGRIRLDGAEPELLQQCLAGPP
jgi:type IV fimbrial biogenesis protein FimT